MADEERDGFIDDEIEEGEEQEKKPRFKLSKTVVRILIIALLLIVNILVATLISLGVNRMKSEPTADVQQLSQPIQQEGSIEYSYYPINNMVLNLSPEGGDLSSSAIVNVSLYLAYPKENRQIETELGLREKEIINAIISAIGRQKYSDIDKVREREEHLKRILKKEINSLMNDPNSILDIFYTEFKITVL